MTARKTATILVVMVIAFAGFLYYVNAHAQSPTDTQSSGSQPDPNSANTLNSVYTPVTSASILNVYQTNAAVASKETGKIVYISGEVGNVEQGSNGRYNSCAGPTYGGSGGVVFTCVAGSTQEQYGGGENVIWYWQSQSVAANVPMDKPFIAECTVEGLDQNGDLNLDGCTIVG